MFLLTSIPSIPSIPVILTVDPVDMATFWRGGTVAPCILYWFCLSVSLLLLFICFYWKYPSLLYNCKYVNHPFYLEHCRSLFWSLVLDPTTVPTFSAINPRTEAAVHFISKNWSKGSWRSVERRSASMAASGGRMWAGAWGILRSWRPNPPLLQWCHWDKDLDWKWRSECQLIKYMFAYRVCLFQNGLLLPPTDYLVETQQCKGSKFADTVHLWELRFISSVDDLFSFVDDLFEGLFPRICFESWAPSWRKIVKSPKTSYGITLPSTKWLTHQHWLI